MSKMASPRDNSICGVVGGRASITWNLICRWVLACVRCWDRDRLITSELRLLHLSGVTIRLTYQAMSAYHCPYHMTDTICIQNVHHEGFIAMLGKT